VLVGASLSLFACGNGREGRASAPSAVDVALTPEGVYAGATSTNHELRMLALENGSLWGIYGRTVDEAFHVHGVVHANGTYNRGSFAAVDARDYALTGAVTSGTVSASYTAAGAFNGSMTTADEALAFTSNRLATSKYDYARPARLADIAGAWTGHTLHGAGTAVTISSGGVVAGNSDSCDFTGTVVPRATGRNVYDVAITFANSAWCAFPGGSAAGIAISYPVSPSMRKLLVAVQHSGRTLGTAFVARRRIE
jgi:hypothetical protein